MNGQCGLSYCGSNYKHKGRHQISRLGRRKRLEARGKAAFNELPCYLYLSNTFYYIPVRLDLRSNLPSPLCPSPGDSRRMCACPSHAFPRLCLLLLGFVYSIKKINLLLGAGTLWPGVAAQRGGGPCLQGAQSMPSWGPTSSIHSLVDFLMLTECSLGWSVFICASFLQSHSFGDGHRSGDVCSSCFSGGSSSL